MSDYQFSIDTNQYHVANLLCLLHDARDSKNNGDWVGEVPYLLIQTAIAHGHVQLECNCMHVWDLQYWRDHWYSGVKVKWQPPR